MSDARLRHQGRGRAAGGRRRLGIPPQLPRASPADPHSVAQDRSQRRGTAAASRRRARVRAARLVSPSARRARRRSPDPRPSLLRRRPLGSAADPSGGNCARWARRARSAGELGRGLAGDLALALHLEPSAGPAVMSFLERRIAELSSTVRVTEDQGGRADPYRRTALRDAVELQDRLAQGSERLFDTSLYFAVWAE